MAFTLNDGQGTLFRNDKDGVETRPDYRGELNIGGVMYRVSGWVKDGNKGKWVSLSVQTKEERPPQPAAKRASQPMDDDDLPF